MNLTDEGLKKLTLLVFGSTYKELAEEVVRDLNNDSNKEEIENAKKCDL